MSDLFNTFQKGVDAIKIYSKMVETSTNNISHAGDKHYTKQYNTVSSNGASQAGGSYKSFGITISDTQHTRNEVIDSNVINTIIAKSSSEGQYRFGNMLESKFKADIESLGKIGDDLSSGGMGSAIDNFFRAFEGLAANPSDNSYKNVVLTRTGILTDRFHEIDAQITSIDASVVSQLSKDVTQVNSILDRVHNLNISIENFERGKTQKHLEARDNRQKAIEELAQFISFDVRPKAGSVAAVQIVSKDPSAVDVLLVDGTALANKIAFDGTNVTTNAGSPVTLALTGGEMKGYMDSRTNILTATRTKFDKLAEQFVTSVNLLYNPTGFSGNFFQSAGTTAATIAKDGGVTLTSLRADIAAASNPGANAIADGIATLSQKKFSTGSGDLIDGTFSQHYAQTVSSLGQTISDIKQSIRTQDSDLRGYESERQRETGISYDEEVTKLLIYQKTIEASFRVMKISADLLDTLVNGILK